MASTVSVLKLIARDASRAARLAAAASRPARSSRAARSAAAAASRAARSAAAAASHAARSSGSVSTCRRSSKCSSCSSSCSDDDDGYDDYSDSDDDRSPDDTSDPMPGKDVTEKDVESDEAVWALYELWCKAYNKERDLPEMARRFNTFKKSAKMVLDWNEIYKNDEHILGSFADGRDEEDAMEIGPPVGAASMNKVRALIDDVRKRGRNSEGSLFPKFINNIVQSV